MTKDLLPRILQLNSHHADGSKSTMALAHFTRDSTDTINLRESQGSEFDQPDGTLYGNHIVPKH